MGYNLQVLSKMIQGSWRLDDFHLLDVLYSNSSGTIYKAKARKGDRRKYALKERKSAELGRNKNMFNEVQLFERLDHANVLKCYGHFWEKKRKSLFMVLEYAEGGDLHEFLKKQKTKGKKISQTTVVDMSIQLCEALCHLHQNGIIHRDIKTLNILMTKKYSCESPKKRKSPIKRTQQNPVNWKTSEETNECPWTLKIGDLGVSRSISNETMMLNTFYGTPLYVSPELCNNKPYNEKTDIWSLGVVLYELAMLKPPFNGENLVVLADNIRTGQFEPIIDKYPPGFINVVNQMLTLDSEKRPGILDVLAELKGCLEQKNESTKVVIKHIPHLTLSDNDEEEEVKKEKEEKKSIKPMNERDRRYELRRIERRLENSKKKSPKRVDEKKEIHPSPKKQEEKIETNKSESKRNQHRHLLAQEEKKSVEAKDIEAKEEEEEEDQEDKEDPEFSTYGRKYNIISGTWQ